MIDFARARRIMVDSQIRTYDVTNRALLAAIEEVPREHFLPEGQEDLAYTDQNLVFGDGEGGHYCMLAPMTLARLLQALNVRPGDRVLDVGGGLGYTAIVLSRLGAKVVSRVTGQALASEARRRLAACDGSEIEIVVGSLVGNYSSDNEYNAIILNGGFEVLPEPVANRLADGGALAGIDTSGGAGRAVLYRRSGSALSRRSLFNASAPTLAGFSTAPAFSF
jgi:protein-L-isoaspartate(D-aspartate) O-methyltransferase